MNTKISKTHLAEIIKAVVRECLQERKQRLAEQHMREVAPPGFGPDKKYAKLYNKIKAQYPNDDAAAYAVMWKAHKKLTEAGLTSEAAYKVVSPNEVDTSKEDKARTIQTEPKVTENHKVQARSAKTVQDLDNDPKNVRDPEVPQA